MPSFHIHKIKTQVAHFLLWWYKTIAIIELPHNSIPNKNLDKNSKLWCKEKSFWMLYDVRRDQINYILRTSSMGRSWTHAYFFLWYLCCFHQQNMRSSREDIDLETVIMFWHSRSKRLKGKQWYHMLRKIINDFTSIL